MSWGDKVLLLLNGTLKVAVVQVMQLNEGKSAASFCRQVAAWFPDMFCYFYFVKKHKIAKNSTATEARKK
jgi:hypothetical protein